MTNGRGADDITCQTAQAALARGGAETDWDVVEPHLASCPDCAPGLDRLVSAIDEQFAATASLSDSPEAVAPLRDGADSAGKKPRVIPFPRRPGGDAVPPPRRPAARQSWWRRRELALGGGLVAAALVAAVVLIAKAGGGGGGAQADRRPEFVPSLEVLPARPDHTYFSGEQVQVCVRINQPSRIHLSEIVGHTTFDLYDADSDPGEHCLPERVGALRSAATLRVEVFYGKERVAREDFPLEPAAMTPFSSPSPVGGE